MDVTIKFVGPVAIKLKKDEARVECHPGTKVEDIFRILIEKLGEEFSETVFEKDLRKVKESISIALKREGQLGYQRLEVIGGMGTELHPNDALILYHPMGGG
jgi:molybdopterin converting factor small subunit